MSDQKSERLSSSHWAPEVAEVSQSLAGSQELEGGGEDAEGAGHGAHLQHGGLSGAGLGGERGGGDKEK